MDALALRSLPLAAFCYRTQGYPYRRFYFTDEKSYRSNLHRKTCWTPKDFREATYRIA